jgi:thymidylate synthase
MTSQFPECESATGAFRATLEALLDLESDLPAEPDAEQLQKATREQLNYGFTLSSPLDRLSPKLRLHVAVARFVWMMAANNRLADIAFYEPKVSGYTDDQLTVPGSSYGMRLRQPQPGLDQIKGAIARLKSEKEKRRAAVVIFHPVDAVRESHDIPCAFGMFLHARNGRLDATLIMRSNNAATLLPFNIFEFSLLMEALAVEAGLDLGSLHYFAGSMHLFESAVDRAASLLAEPMLVPAPMVPMPRNVSALDQLTILGQLDAELRHHSSSIDRHSAEEWCEKIRDRLAPYWAQFGYLLLAAIAAKVDQATLKLVVSRLSAELKPFAPTLESNTKRAAAGDIVGLFDDQNSNVIAFPRPSAESERQFARLAEAYEAKNGSVPARKLLRTREVVFERLAARGDSLNAELFEKIVHSID